jgi:predicted RNA-binding Zn-ribbon protein involved in translation (DUF1610 family)
MTREYAVEMIKAIKNGLHETGKDFPYRDEIIPIAKEALDMAITELKQKPCDDAISRQNATAQCFQAMKIVSGEFGQELSHDDKSYNAGLRKAVEIIRGLTPVTPQPKMGQWISLGIQGEIDGQIVRAFSCSECGAISIFRMTGGEIVNGDLCPNCGAKIQEVKA